MYIPVPENILHIHKNVILGADIMYVNGLTFLTMISENICFRTAHYIDNREAKTIFLTIDKVHSSRISYYTHAHGS